MLEYKDPVWANESHSLINMEIRLDKEVRDFWANMDGQWVSFCASPDDIMDYGRWLFDQASNGYVAPYVPPTPEDIRASAGSISRRQLRLTLVRNGISLSSVSDAIDAMPEGLDRDEMRIEWDDGTTYERLNPRLLAIAGILGLSSEQVDAMWEEARIA